MSSTASAWQARYATAAGDPETARRIATGKARERRLYGQQHLETLLEALATLEDRDAVAELLPEGRARADGNALLAPVGDWVEGLAHTRAGRTAKADRALRRALDRFERLSDPFEPVRTREHLAAVAPAPDACSLLEAALATYERLACARANGPHRPASALSSVSGEQLDQANQAATAAPTPMAAEVAPIWRARRRSCWRACSVGTWAWGRRAGRSKL